MNKIFFMKNHYISQRKKSCEGNVLHFCKSVRWASMETAGFSLAPAFSRVWHAILIEIYEGNLASHRYGTEEGITLWITTKSLGNPQGSSCHTLKTTPL